MIVKQVIVIRKDLGMRRGKEIAQGSHASMKWLVDRLKERRDELPPGLFTPEEEEWLFNEKFTKICLRVNSEKELLSLYENALTSRPGLTTGFITDSGATEFHGIPTNTCLAIGPNGADKIDPLTQNIKLY